MFVTALFVTGSVSGLAACVAAIWLVGPEAPVLQTECPQCAPSHVGIASIIRGLRFGKCSACHLRRPYWPWLTTILVGLLFAFYGWMLITRNCQAVTEVRPESPLWLNRLPFHLVFIWLLVVVTLTDLLDYIIADVTVICGIVIAVSAAAISGELQIIHVWVDWNHQMVELHGPWLPEWMKHHQHLHGIAWTLSGLVVGAGLMWTLRVVASTILGYPAVGLGDVTLMALIGAFLGWQPTLCVLALSPVVGIVVGMGIRLVTGRSFVAFGPYLAVAAFAVLCSWRFLWVELSLRTLFGDWQTVMLLTGGTLAAISMLLILLRIYRALPTSAMRR
jgi:leader peptidase (prepilin peptidase) / N-methyltransferase